MMSKIFLVALLIAVIACAAVVALIASGVISLPPASEDQPVLVLSDMYLKEIPVYEPTDPTSSIRKGVKLGLEFRVEKDAENAALEYIRVLIYSEAEKYSPSAFISKEYYDSRGFWNESDPAIPDHTIQLPKDCVFEWQPQWDDGTAGYGENRPQALPPLNQSGLTVRVTALGLRWLENGEWHSEYYSDTSEEIIEFKLPMLNTLTLKGTPSLTGTPIAPNVYP
ncbi:MAG: hypothetical protein JSV35_00025 [Candidatus Bathyarchaeota archaeon]|nr:MAG: hypothetical protein JSV35_00025 [Candidatus Bathyarchaeota archaeon]